LQKTIKAPKEWLREIDVEIEPDQLKSKINTVFDEYKGRIALPGFRPGKAPRHVLEKKLGAEMESSAVEELVEAAVNEVVAESNLHIATQPKMTTMEVTPEKAIRFQISVEVIPDFEIKPYEGLVLKKEEPEGFDAEFDERLAALQEKCATFKVVNRAAKAGDFVVTDYRTMVGETVLGDERKNVMVEVGDKLASDEVNKALEGAKAGDERSADVPYPADYPNKDFAGKTVTYKFAVRDVKEREMPDVSEEFAQDLGYESLDALRIEINEEIIADRKRLTENGLKNQVFDRLTAEHQFEPPETWVKASLARLSRQYELPDDAQTQEKLMPVAVKWAKFDCIVARIADKENISISDDEIGEAVQALAAQSKSSVEEVAQLIDNPMYRNQLLREKVLRLVRDKARVE
jgi:trigger factor